MFNLKLTQDKYSLIDSQVPESIFSRKWYFTSTGYAANKSKLGIIYLHRFILGAHDGEIVDHINGDKLDNRLENLRIVGYGQNIQNRPGRGTSKYKGVHLRKDTGKWRAQITVQRKIKHLGYYVNELDAYKAYEDAALAIYGKGQWQTK